MLRLLLIMLLLQPVAAHAYDKTEGQAFHDAYNACEYAARDKKHLTEARACFFALKPQKPATRAQVAYRAAELLEKGEKLTEARAEFLAVAKTYPRESMGARARFRAARILEDRFNDAAAAEVEYRSLVREAPDSIAALNALVHLEERIRETSGAAALIAFYDAELSARPMSTLAPVMLERMGMIALESKEYAARAVKVFDILAKRKNAKLDDALYFGAKARVLAGDVDGAVKSLLTLLASRERSPIPNQLVPGDLHSSKLDDARYLLAEIMRDNVGDKRRAREYFELLLQESPDSRLVDDTLYALGALSLSSGDRASAAKYYAELIEKRPESRYVRKVKDFKP